MAYMSQTKKAELAPAVKAALKKYGIKGSLSVHNHTSLVLTLKSGKIDFVKNYIETVQAHPRYNDRELGPVTHIDVNVYHYRDHFSGDAKKFLTEVITAMSVGNFDHSDSQTDYFHVGWWLDVQVGRWDKPYEVLA